jgi:hypothetical protein
MTKKDYTKFARMIRKWNTRRLEGVETSFFHVVGDFVELFEEDNPRFDTAKFLTAVYTGEGLGEQ